MFSLTMKAKHNEKVMVTFSLWKSLLFNRIFNYYQFTNSVRNSGWCTHGVHVKEEYMIAAVYFVMLFLVKICPFLIVN